MEQGTKRELYKIIQAQTDPLKARVDQLAGTYVNRTNGLSLAGSATIPTATTAADTLIVWLLQAPILASGLFDVRLSAAVTGLTTADSINWIVATDYATTQPVYANNVAFGSRSAFFKGLVVGSSYPAMFTNSGTAAGITYTNGHVGQPGTTMYATGAQVAVTSALNQMFSFTGTVGLSITAGSGIVNPFVAANTYAIIYLMTLISAGSATFQSFSADVSERPW
jgi:hypothetical protein